MHPFTLSWLSIRLVFSGCVDWVRNHLGQVETYTAFMALAAFQAPYPLWFDYPGLDASWQLGLHLAARGLPASGWNLAYSYGPLGFLFFPAYVQSNLWVLAVAFQNTVSFLFYASLATLAIGTKNRLTNAFVLGLAGPLYYWVLFNEYLTGATFFLVSYLVVRGNKPRLLDLMGGFSALLLFTKLDVGLMAISIIVTATVWRVFRSRRLDSLTPIVASVSVLLILGIFLCGSLGAFWNFLVGATQVALGYTPGLSLDQFDAVGGVVLLLSASVIVMTLLWSRMEGTQGLDLLFVLGLPFLFFTYKRGIVRADLHILVFLASWSLFFLLLQGTSMFDKVKARRLAVLSTAVVLLLGAFELSVIPGLNLTPSLTLTESEPLSASVVLSDTGGGLWLAYTSGITNLGNVVYYALNPSLPRTMFESSVADVRNQYNLSLATVRLIGNNTMDVLPWEISLAYAYGFNWDPAPMFQSFTAFTPYLDQMNSRHYNGSEAPMYVLYKLETVDGRYPLFDEPATMLQLACNYRIVGFDHAFFILKRGVDACGGHEFLSLGTADSEFGRPVAVPAVANGSVIAKVFLRQNVLGEVVSLPYKLPPVTIEMQFSDGRNGTYRFIPSVGEDGLLLDFGAVNLLQPASIAKLTFETGGESFYDGTIRVDFYRGPPLPFGSYNSTILESLSSQARLPVSMLLSTYYTRTDLQAVFPDSFSNKTSFRGLVNWAGGTVTHQWVDGAFNRLNGAGYWYDLMMTYNLRPDLQAAFPDAYSNQTSFQGLINWAHGVVTRAFPDASYPNLIFYASYYENHHS